MNRLLYLAVADGRGHLIRAAQLRKLLGKHGISVDVLTTDAAGQAFLDELGVKADRLRGGYSLHFNATQNMDLPRAQRSLLGYLLTPWRCLRHALWLKVLSWKYDHGIVNDSLHPAPLLAAALFGVKVTNVVGEHILSTTEDQLQSHWVMKRLFHWAMRKCKTVVHVTGTEPVGNQLPTLIPRPKRRAGLPSPLAAVYLNPLWADDTVGMNIVAACEHWGYTVVGVSEALAGRIYGRWVDVDPDFCDVIFAADIVISTPSAATLTQVMTFGKPFIALTSNQPEQERNLAAVADCDHIIAVDPLNRRALTDAVGSLMCKPAVCHGWQDELRYNHYVWVNALKNEDEP